MPKIFGISRIFCKKSYPFTPPVEDRLEWFLNAGVDTIIAVVSSKQDEMEMDLLLAERYPRDRVHVVSSLGFEEMNDWSVGLNQGLRSILRNYDLIGDELVLPFSFTMHLSKETLDEMKQQLGGDVGVVGVRFPGYTALSYQHPRNTCALYPLVEVAALGGWNVDCDKLGGQEDFEMALQLLFKGKKIAMVDSNDVLEGSAVYNQSEKEARELSAIEQIVMRTAKERGVDVSEVLAKVHDAMPTLSRLLA